MEFMEHHAPPPVPGHVSAMSFSPAAAFPNAEMQRQQQQHQQQQQQHQHHQHRHQLSHHVYDGPEQQYFAGSMSQDQQDQGVPIMAEHDEAGANPGRDAGAGVGGAPPGSGLKPIRRRNRMINSCLECRKRKLRCSKNSPSCMNCLKAGRDCLYIGPRLDEASQLRLAEIKEKQGSLERQLERDVAKSSSSAAAAARGNLQQRILADEVGDEYQDDEDLETTPLVALDLTYEDDADGADEMIDLGIQIGKMRITERIGGLSRPRISEEISAGIGAQRSPGGPPAGFGGLPPGMGFPGMGIPGAGLPPGLDAMSDGGSDLSIPDFLRPSAQYIAPTSGFFFGQVVEQPSILGFLPHRAAADRLMRQYFISCHPIAPCTHMPSLETTYATFWEDVNAGFEPRPSTQAIVFAAMFSGVLAMDEDEAFRELGGYAKTNWMASLKMGTETALSKANFLRTTKIETMQAFIMYMLPLCRAEVSRAHSVLVGAAVRMAECMGLHRDGEAYGLTPLETHVRRLIWHQLCFLDIRTCEAQGPKPVIRREDYDTKLPLNCNDGDLTHAVVPPKASEHFTTSTLALIRFEINEMMRIVWLDRRRLETRKTTLTAVLSKVENFRRRMREKYDGLLDRDMDQRPLQRYAKCVMHLLTYRLHVMVLHPYHANAATPMPPRLAGLLVTSGVVIVELAAQLETSPAFAPWAWYLGAYFQYQIALLLATEVYYRPQSREAGRIWACLDYVFGMDRRLPPEAKGLQLLAEIQDKTAVYMRMRKMRGPSFLRAAVLGQNALAGTGIGSGPGVGAAKPGGAGGYASQQEAQQQQQVGGYGQPLELRQVGGYAQQQPQQQQPSPSLGQAGMQQAGVLEPSVQQQQQMTMNNTNTNGMQQMPPQPPPQMVFAGVSDGQALWGLPPNHHDSPGSSDTSSVHGMQAGGMGGSSAGAAPMGGIMDNIDWDTINALFPHDPQTGGLSVQGFHDQNFGFVDWSV